MKYPKFSHKTPHLKGKQHQLDPNLDLKQLVHHATVQYVDRDNDGDVDVYDNPKKGIPDENPNANFATTSKKLIAKQKGEIKHTKRGMAYEGSLHKWFKSSSSKDGKPGWVNVVTGGTCASDEPGEGTPKCVSSAKRASMTDAERRSAARRKKAADPGQQQKTGAAKPTYVSTDSPKMKKEELDLQEVKDKPGKGSGKKDACYNKVKSRYSVWPSAYASGALVKCRKVGADNWGTKTEEMHMHEEERYCPLCKKRETRSECSYGEKAWDKVSVRDEEYSMARSEISTIVDAVRRLKEKVGKGEGNLEAWVQSKITKAADYIDTAADYVAGGEMDEACWSGYKQVGMKKKGKRKVPNCVPEETIEDLNGNTFAEVIDLIKPEPIRSKKMEKNIEEMTRLQAKTGNLMMVVAMWRGKSYSLKMFFPQSKLPTKKEVEEQIQKVYPGSKVIYSRVTEQQPGEPILQVEAAAWTKKEGKSESGGLNEKGRRSYEKENPGSDLKAPSKKVGNPRRASFCARMKGMKSKLTSAKTANDPDSRINKSLRAWNCN
jgi:ribosomal protein S24E